MEDTAPPPITEEPKAPATSLLSRMINIFAAPGEVFDEVKSSRRTTGNWLAPVLLSCVAGVIYTWVIFSQPAVLQQLREKQREQMDKMVAEGKMKAEDAEKAQAMMEGIGPTIVKISGMVGAIVASFGWLFVAALGLKLLGKHAFHSSFPYMKAVEVTGLAGVIPVLSSIIQMLIVVVTGKMLATPGPVLLLPEIDPANKGHLLLASLNIMTLWYVGVLAVGLARLSGTAFGKAALWLYGLWVALRLLIVFTGMAASGM